MKLEDLKGKEIEITDEGFLKVVEKKGKFVPKKGEKDELYWYVDSYGYVGSELEYDEWLIKHKPVFQTQKEAEEYKHYLELLDKYKYEFSDEEWINENIEKWHLCCYTINGKLSIFCKNLIKYPNCVYFKSYEDVNDFIKEVGEDNVKKFMFDVWE